MPRDRSPRTAASGASLRRLADDLAISSKKPMSSMRSASSSTSVRTPRRSSALLAQLILDAARRADHDVRRRAPATRAAGAAAMPPESVSTLMLAMPRASRRISLADLVGEFARRAQHQRLHGESARIEPGAAAQPKAAVLPLPVGALPIRSRPSSIAGRLWAWIGRHAHVAQRIQALEQRGIERQVGEFGQRLCHPPMIAAWLPTG